jgi:hypothetical protein
MTAAARPILGLVPCLLVLAGCASQTPAPAPQPSPSTRGVAPGLELTWWIIDQSGPHVPSLDAALEPFASNALPVPWKTVDLWHANGLRLVSVPVAKLDDLRASLRSAGPLQTQWLGLTPRWTEIARGPAYGRPSTLGLDGGSIVLRDGHLRLMLRCWVSPGQQVPGLDFLPGALQVEVMPEFVPDAPARALALPGEEPNAAPVRFVRLALETTLLTDDALLIVPEGAAVDGPGPDAVGPVEPPLPTLGESMLVSADASLNRLARVVIVLTPTVPREYGLLPRVR